MKITLKTGTTSQDVHIHDANILDILEPNEVAIGLTGEDEVRRALAEPIGTGTLSSIVHAGEKIVIVTSDITRPMPTSVVMPWILDELYSAGISRKDITLVFALGSHRHHSDDEIRSLAGERAYAEITCIDGDPSDFVHLGVTSRGTPIDIVRVVAEADRRICLGNIEYHYFAGYSGGAKAIMPGVSTRDAIQANHRLMVEPTAHAGQLNGNPIREDIEEAVSKVGVDFILNVVLDKKKQIIKAVAGDVVLAHRAGYAYLDTLYSKKISQKADIVIVSQGGSPKDINLYQTQKALDNAKHAVKKGGVIILIGSCKEGLGERVFEEWLLSAPTSHSLIERISRDFQLGGHKAAAIAMVLEIADIYLVSDMDDSLVQKIFMQPYHSVQQAYDAAIEKCGTDASVIIMPYGGATLPQVEFRA